MTTYTTPHFATGLPQRNVRTLDKETNDNARGVRPAVYREPTLVADELAQARTPDWQPAANKGMPRAAIGALGAALVGGAALAFVLMSPSTVTRPLDQNQVAAASPARGTTAGSSDPVSSMNNAEPAAGTAAPTPTPTEQRAQSGADAAQATAAQAVAAPAATAPLADKHAMPVASAHPARRVQPQPAATPEATAPATRSAPVATPDAPATVTPQVESPAMQQTPDSTTVTPSQPDTGTSPAPAPTSSDGQ